MADWVVVVDDDVTNLKMAGHILSKEHMRVTALKSGRALLDYVSLAGDLLFSCYGLKRAHHLRMADDGLVHHLYGSAAAVRLIDVFQVEGG